MMEKTYQIKFWQQQGRRWVLCSHFGTTIKRNEDNQVTDCNTLKILIMMGGGRISLPINSMKV